jgi:16S rRNA G1207 methylase RsmC
VPPETHYFTSEPLDPASTRTIQVQIAGRPAEVVTAPGVFSPDRIDLGTSVLLRTLSREDARSGLPDQGTLVDLGCGWGPLTLTMASLAPAARVIAIDVNQAARQLTAVNAQRLGLDNVTVMDPAEAAGIGPVDALWSNPPIRIGKSALHDLLAEWLGRLGPQGQAWLVVQRHLGADSLHTWLEGLGIPAHRAASAKGYRVLRAGPRQSVV